MSDLDVLFEVFRPCPPVPCSPVLWPSEGVVSPAPGSSPSVVVAGGVHVGDAGAGSCVDEGSAAGGTQVAVSSGAGAAGSVGGKVVLGSGSSCVSLEELVDEELVEEELDDVFVFAFVVVDDTSLVVRLGAGGRSTAGLALANAQVEVLPAKITAAPSAATSRMFTAAILPGRGS